ncbi:hypothetical protein Btru_062423 [Bulinus truncatus]|nr:hypothetical protein Btru_062423 [Bulinus truncatus]
MRNADTTIPQNHSMQFHLTHGTAIQLTEGQTLATRKNNTFCNGIVFFNQPIRVNHKHCIELGTANTWSGSIRIGITTINPSKFRSDQLPRFVYPDWIHREEFWIRVINEKLTTHGCQLMVYVNHDGQLQLFVNGNHKGTLLYGLPVNQNLWLLLDIYGNTVSAKIVVPEDVPREIFARGPQAVDAYEQACTTGTQPVFRTRLMLVGQERVGKTSLMRSLTGESHNKDEESTDGINLSASCSFNLNNRSSWKLAIKGDETARREKEENSLDIEAAIDLEEEYNRAIANNIAQELLTIMKKDGEAQPVIMDSGNKKDNTVSSSFAALESIVDKDIILVSSASQQSVLHEGVPDKIACLVQEILDERRSRSADAETTKGGGGQKVILNIWDFAGQAVYYTTHQVSEYSVQGSINMSTLEYMDFWMRSIHAHAAENTRNNLENTALSPPIFIVGTHRDSLSTDAASRADKIDTIFAKIRDFLVGKPYAQHVVLPFFAIENSADPGEDLQIEKLRAHIEFIASKQSYIGEQMPIKWLRFEQDITAQADAGIHFATYNQVYEIAVNHNITSTSEVQALLTFYHDLGMLIYFGCSVSTDFLLNNTVVLSPQWLVSMFQKITVTHPPKEKWNLMSDCWKQLVDHGVLEEALLSSIWPDSSDHHNFLLGLMSKFDLICPKLPTTGQTYHYGNKSWYVPMRFNSCKDKSKVYVQTIHDACFYIDFIGFLPNSLFQRLQVKCIHWSQEHGGRDLYLAEGIVRLFVDSDHDLLIEMCPSYLHRIKVLVMHVRDKEATSSKRNTRPVPDIVARVRHFLEGCLEELRVMWMKRLAYKMYFTCPCDKICILHNRSACSLDDCIHFLDLNECLANQTNRRILYILFRLYVVSTGVSKPSLSKSGFLPYIPVVEFREPILAPLAFEKGLGNIEQNFPSLPSWLKGAAKLLNGAPDNQGWFALARAMGYKQNQIDLFNEDLNPSLALLTDWIVSSGNTTMSVDVLLHYLLQLGCHDVIEVITRAKEFEFERPQVFLSYQWDMQDDVSSLRDYLERCGYSCWMDIGQMGGGDQLSSKIDQGLRGCKVVVACVTPKYIASHLCNRELWLADMLHKPIIPVVLETVSWPPPGAMAVILSQLVYISMKGIGGHGGTGIHADLMDKYSELVQRVSLYAKPDLTPCVDNTFLPPHQHQPMADRMSDRMSGYRTSMSSLSELDFHRRQVSHYEPSLEVTVSRFSEPLVTGSQGSNQNNSSMAHSVNYSQSVSHPVPQANVKHCAVCNIL